MVDLYSTIISHISSKYPEEACGLVVNISGNLSWYPCDNIAEDKEEDFKISGVDYIKANMLGDIYAVVHSHPNTTAELSDADKKASEFLRVRYIVISIPDLEIVLYKPKLLIQPYTGRAYKEKENDCWSLVQDYYSKEFDKSLIVCDHYTKDWRDEGINIHKDNMLSSLGFEIVDTPEVGDLVAFSVMSKYPNHFGIYIGGNLFLHHAENRLSCREPLAGIWAKYLEGFLRCKKFI